MTCLITRDVNITAMIRQGSGRWAKIERSKKYSTKLQRAKRQGRLRKRWLDDLDSLEMTMSQKVEKGCGGD